MMDNTAESPSGCLVILIPLSSSMTEDTRVWLAHRLTADGESEIRDIPKSLAARFLADELLEGLVNTLASGYPVPLDVAVLGYNAKPDGSLNLVSLLPGDNRAARFVPLAEVAALEVDARGREGDPRKWTTPVECSGTASATAALAEVYKMTAMWLTGRFTSRPPVVIHVTDGSGLDEHYPRMARSLGLLGTGYGSARLLHVGFTADAEPTLCGLWGESVSEPWAGLFELSALLPAEPEGRPARWGVSVNDWSLTDAWSALFDLNWIEDSVNWQEGDTDRFEAASARGMWTQKMGNTPEQWEDAYATEPTSGTAAIADGASSGIYCRTWADRLAKSFISERPDVRDPIVLGKWVHGLRAEWRSAIDYDKLNWSKKAKVDDVGAAATLLVLEVGSADAEGNRPWRACAVGDASLFWLRGNQLLGTFPVVAADQFGSAPLLVRSNPGYKTLALAASGVCRPGDRFFLATDAVAARLLKSAALGSGPDWLRFESIDETAWREELDVLRKANDMVNDDCTLVTLRVSGGEPVAEVPRTEAEIAASAPEEVLVVDHYEEPANNDLPAVEEQTPALDLTSPLVGEVGEPQASRVGGEDLGEATPHPHHSQSAATSPTRGEVEKTESSAEAGANGEASPDSTERTPTRDGFSDSTETPSD